MMGKKDLESNLIRVHEWIRAADQKVSIFLAFQGVVLTIIFPAVSSWVLVNIKIFSYANLVILTIAFVSIGYGIYKSASAIIPRLVKDRKQKSITYFGDIAKFELTDFKKNIKQMNAEEYENELIEQIHISAKIALRKHIQFRDAIFVFSGGMFLLAVDFLVFQI